MAHVSYDVDKLLGDGKDKCPLIDESRFVKQGNRPIAISRHWLDRLRKVGNGRVAVFGALANGQFTLPIDVRFYLYEERTYDPERCKRAVISEDHAKVGTANMQ